MKEVIRDENWFWKLIEDSLPHESEYSIEQHKSQLLRALDKLTDVELLQFANKFEDYYQASYVSDLWNAGYIIQNGMGDDDFSDFRRALIVFGRDVYERTLSDPEYLASFSRTQYLITGETFSYLVHETLEKRMDEDAALEAISSIYRETPEIDAKQLLEGPEELKAKYPILFEKFRDTNFT